MPPNRLYNDLAWLWPLWEKVADYKPESARFIKLINKHCPKAKAILDIACGGGKNDYYLKKRFAVTGLDLSPQMIALAKKLNPQADYHLGDMRSFDLGKKFDVVFFNDGIIYMRTKEDLLKALKNARRHLMPGGVMALYVEDCQERFEQSKTSVWRSRSGGYDITYIENDYDPDPRDSSYEMAFVYIIRRGKILRIEHDTHTAGLFSLDQWRRTMKQAGFKVIADRPQKLGDELVQLLVGKNIEPPEL
ncbi:class I SAM-dependent methyltransferase [candidate division TA06 bacterium]|uniref:Class I SAM-dependent methyltransferase n=1 Tax=candidate division TA06 bacterium TaxID=2250710 RepID=A0A933I9Z7_UNCT6|nr:class I SAM-dependent methyltransferase [candidate division TA06 bacterium]